MSLNNIPIKVETNLSFGILLPLLHEIRHGLTKLLNHHEDTLIDLYNFPLSKTDKQTLFQVLGTGEIRAELTALGRSLIWETSLSGVWIVEHYNTEEILLSHSIEITWIPSILKAPPEDVRNSLERLQEYLSGEHH